MIGSHLRNMWNGEIDNSYLSCTDTNTISGIGIQHFFKKNVATIDIGYRIASNTTYEYEYVDQNEVSTHPKLSC